MKKQTSSSKKIIAIFALFLAAFTWGSAFCVLKDTLENVSPIWLLAFRFLLAGIIMTLVCIPREAEALTGSFKVTDKGVYRIMKMVNTTLNGSKQYRFTAYSNVIDLSANSGNNNNSRG